MIGRCIWGTKTPHGHAWQGLCVTVHFVHLHSGLSLPRCHPHTQCFVPSEREPGIMWCQSMPGKKSAELWLWQNPKQNPEMKLPKYGKYIAKSNVFLVERLQSLCNLRTFSHCMQGILRGKCPSVYPDINTKLTQCIQTSAVDIIIVHTLWSG